MPTTMPRGPRPEDEPEDGRQPAPPENPATPLDDQGIATPGTPGGMHADKYENVRRLLDWEND